MALVATTQIVGLCCWVQQGVSIHGMLTWVVGTLVAGLTSQALFLDACTTYSNGWLAAATFMAANYLLAGAIIVTMFCESLRQPEPDPLLP